MSFATPFGFLKLTILKWIIISPLNLDTALLITFHCRYESTLNLLHN